MIDTHIHILYTSNIATTIVAALILLNSIAWRRYFLNLSLRICLLPLFLYKIAYSARTAIKYMIRHRTFMVGKVIHDLYGENVDMAKKLGAFSQI